MTEEWERIGDVREVKTPYGPVLVRTRRQYKIPYNGKYPSAYEDLKHEGIIQTRPIQRERVFAKGWAKGGVDITYQLHNLGPANFNKYADILLLLAYQEAERYKGVATHVGALFDVKLIRKSGASTPDFVSFESHMRKDADLMVYGPGYETPYPTSLADKSELIKDITKRYSDKVQRQRPFRVIRLLIRIRIREPK